jgi:3-hydroxybutyryl-CoA dehydrogenase
MQERRAITVVGAGFMGTVIATLYARHGYPVFITDCAPSVLTTFRERARPIAESLVDEQLDCDAILSGVSLEPSLETCVQQSFLVHEVIHENLEAKQDLFARLDEACDADVMLATNTSSFPLAKVCKKVGRRERVIGIHYVTPAHIVRLVELIVADFTPATLIDRSRRFLKTIDHVGIVCKDTPGFVVNRLQYALVAEAYRMVEEGVASEQDIDSAIRLSIGPRLALWGPLLTEDLVVNKRTTAAVWEYLHEHLGRDHFRKPSAVAAMVAAGRLGATSGAGWYRFSRSYPDVVSSRDAQLSSLLRWLRVNDHLTDLGVTPVSDALDSPSA